jgi:type I restriction enzyme S subunit
MDSGEWKVKTARHSQLSTLNSPFKQTEVGVIPEDWELLPLGQATEYIKGFAFKADDYRSHGIRILRVSDTTYDGVKDGEGIYLDVAKANSFRKWALREGDLVVSTVGSKPPMYDLMVGKATYIRAKDSGALLNQNAVILRSRQWSLALQRLLHNHLRQNRYLTHIERIFRGNANQASITLKELFEYQIPIPPTKAEQEAIAEALSDADALIESLEQLIAKKRQIKQGAMQELLTGKKRLSGFNGAWEVKRLEELAEIRSGGTPSTSQAQYWDGDILWCTPTDITALKGYKYLARTSRTISALGLKYSSAEMIPANSIVMTSRATIGECAINQVPMTTNQGFKNFVPFENMDVEFIYYLLVTKKQDFISLCGGSTFLEIGKTQLANFEVQLPVTKAEQTAIATILTDMDAEIAALAEKLTKAHQLKQGMMQELLTGKVRLV